MKITPFDVSDYLDSPGRIEAYLNAAFAENDPTVMQEALGAVAKAQGMATVAQATGLTREGLYRSLSERGNAEAATLVGVVKALGFRLKVELLEAGEAFRAQAHPRTSAQFAMMRPMASPAGTMGVAKAGTSKLPRVKTQTSSKTVAKPPATAKSAVTLARPKYPTAARPAVPKLAQPKAPATTKAAAPKLVKPKSAIARK